MSTDGNEEVFRLKMNCADEAQFNREFARKIARQVFVPMAAPLSRGTNFKLQIKFTDGEVRIRGVATVVQVVEKPARGVRARFISLADDSIQFLLGAEKAGDDELAAAPADMLKPTNSGVLTQYIPVRSSAPDAHPTPPRAASLNVLAALAHHAPKPEPVPEPIQKIEPVPVPVALPVPVPAAVVPAGPGRSGRLVLAVVAVLAVVGLGGWWASSIGARNKALEDQLTAFDASVNEGRLAGPGGNSALDRLIAARALAPDDARVKDRSGQLVQVFSVLAQKALEREDFAEAAVHLQAVLLADPSDLTAAPKLKAAEERVKQPHKTN